MQRGEVWLVDLGYLGKVRPALKEGAFDVQQTAAIQATKFVRRLGHH
jgi:hypothetical protein